MKHLPYTRKEAKDWAKKTLVGWYSAPLTPMTNDYKMDEAGMRENLEAYIQMGENGLVVGGFLAEAWNLKPSDWMKYHEIMADANRGRLPLWTIILDPNVHQALEKMNFVQELGYAGAEVMNPVVQLKTEPEIYDYFKYMSDNSDLALFLYRTPVSGTIMSRELIQKLAQIDTMVGVKQGVLNPTEAIALRKMVPENFVVSYPDERWWLYDLLNGGKLFWAHFTHIVYGKKRPVFDQYTKLALEGKWKEAYKLWETLEPVRSLQDELFTDVLTKTQSYASAGANIKAWYEAIGLKAGPMIPPVKNLSPEQKERIKQKVKDIGIA